MFEIRCRELGVNAALQQYYVFEAIKNIAKLKNDVFIVQHKLCKVISSLTCSGIKFNYLMPMQLSCCWVGQGYSEKIEKQTLLLTMAYFPQHCFLIK